MMWNDVVGKVKHILGRNTGGPSSLTPILTISTDYLEIFGLWDNTIRLSCMARQKDSVEYSENACFGDNLIGHMSCNILDLTQIQDQFILLLVDVDDWMTDGQFAEDIVPYSLSDNIGTADDYVVVMMGTNQARSVPVCNQWSERFVESVEHYLNNTVKVTGNGSKHHHSVGKYFGLGTIAKYGKSGNVSYGPVAHKSGVDEKDRQQVADAIIQDITFMANELNLVISGIVEGGQCITQALIDHSKEIGNKYETISTINQGMVTAYACKNAQTRDFHIEKDCSYTMIAVPWSIPGINSCGSFQFQFKWNNNGGVINVKLNQGTVLYYSGYSIMHRQISTMENCDGVKDRQFWNLSTYGNKRFYQNAMKSFQRIMQCQVIPQNIQNY